MKLLDRIALGRAIKMILDFLYKIIKLYGSRQDDSRPVDIKPRPLWRRRNDKNN
jgi:hypothetical protein